MPGQKTSKSSVANEDAPGLRRSARNKERLKDKQPDEHSIESPPPLSTSSLRNKLVRKPIKEYGKTTSSPSTETQNQSNDDYTRLLEVNNDEVDHFEVPKPNLNYAKSPFTTVKAKKISNTPNIQNYIAENALSPPNEGWKTSSPINATEVFEAPTSAIPGPSQSRPKRYQSDSSTYSHDESYISSRSERLTRMPQNKLVEAISLKNESTKEQILSEHTIYTTENSSIKSNLDLSDARKRSESIKRSQREREEQEHQDRNATWTNSGIIYICSSIVLLVAIVAFVKMGGTKTFYERLRFLNTLESQNSSDFRTEAVKELINELKEKFPSQSDDTWKVVASNIQRIGRKTSNQAACIVFVKPVSLTEVKGSEECIVSTIAARISRIQARIKNLSPNSLPSVTLDSKNFRNSRSYLHSTMEHKLLKNSAVALLDINRLDGGTAMALHTFCDSDATGGEDTTMAPYAHTAVLTTLKVKSDDLPVNSFVEHNATASNQKTKKTGN